MPTEDYAIVLDYLPEGRQDSNTPGYKREKRIAQALGEKYFSLLEVVIREGITLKSGDRIYIGKDVRKEVHHIKRRVLFGDLTSTGKVELEYTLNKLVEAQEQKFVRFFNECGPLTTRLHRLELLPGVGKKHMWDITKARDVKKFASFKDVSERVKLLPDPEKLVVKRILWELSGVDDKGKTIKYRIFVGVPLFHEEEKAPEEKKEEKPAEKKDATPKTEKSPE